MATELKSIDDIDIDSLSLEEARALLAAVDEEQSRIDRVHRLTHHFWIKRANGKITLLDPLKPSQLKVLNLVWYLRRQGKPVRVIVLKARKTGISTAIEADMLCEVFDKQIDALVIAHDLDTAKYIFTMSQFYYERYELPKPRKKQGNVKELNFFAPHKGRMMVATANNKMAGTGMSPQFLHSSETSKWETGAQTAISLFQSVAAQAGTTIIHESTANGYDDLFYPIWKDAWENCRVHFDKNCGVSRVEILNPKEWNYYYPVFISVFDDPDCRMGFADEEERRRFEQTMDDTEREIVAKHGCDLEYINYRRYTLKNSCQNDLDIYFQEHSETPDQSFIASGRPRFHRGALSTMPVEEGRRGMLLRATHGWQKTIEFRDDRQEMLVVYRSPVQGHRYVIGVDTAEGKVPEGCKKPDASVAIVLDKDEGMRQVAALYGQVSEENMVPYIDLLGRWYNMAYLVIEINWGGQVIPSRLMGEYGYPPDRFFHIDDWKEGKSNRAAGWKTTVNTRNNLIADLAEVIQEREIIVHDRKTVEELMNFVWKDGGRCEAMKGFHDDHVFALGLGVQGCRHYPAFDAHDPMTVRRMAEQREQRRRMVDSITGYMIPFAIGAMEIWRNLKI